MRTHTQPNQTRTNQGASAVAVQAEIAEFEKNKNRAWCI